jgi:hypothetical protein
LLLSCLNTKRENDRCKMQSHHYFDMRNVKLSNHNVGCKTRKQLFIVAWGDTWIQMVIYHKPWVIFCQYRKPPTISSGLIYFRKRFLKGLYKGGPWAYIQGGLYTGGLIHGRSFVLVINKSGINKSVINRKINMY